MVIIGERINSTNKNVADALEKKDESYIRKLAVEQADAGADYIDVNAGTFAEEEADLLVWLVKTVQAAVSRPCCIDSPNSRAVAKALEVHQGQALINSLTFEKDKCEKLIPLVRDHRAKVVSLCLGEKGIPATYDERFRVAVEMIDLLCRKGVQPQDIYVDPLIQPIAVSPSAAAIALEVIGRVKQSFPDTHTIGGISNISFGMPLRPVINAAFLAMAVARGLDTAILNPCDPYIRSAVLASEALAERDAHGIRFISAFRKGKIT